MTKLSDILSSESWLLQPVQDCFALRKGISLQLVSQPRLSRHRERLLHVTRETQDKSKTLTKLTEDGPSSIQSYLKDFASGSILMDHLGLIDQEALRDLELHLTHTRASNVPPLISIFRMHRIWRAWEKVWIWNACEATGGSSQTLEMNITNDTKIIYHITYVSFIDSYLIAGPVIAFPNADYDYQSSLSHQFQLVHAFLDVLETNGINPSVDRGRLHEAATLRMATTRYDFEQRVSDTIRTLLTLGEVEVEDEFPIHVGSIHELTSALIFFEDYFDSHTFKLSVFDKRRKHRFFMSLHQYDKSRSNIQLAVSVFKNTRSYETSNESSLPMNGISRRISSKGSLISDSSVDELETWLLRYLSSSSNKRNVAFEEQSYLMQAYFLDRLESIDFNSDYIPQTPYRDAELLARVASEISNADAAFVYLANHSKDDLQLVAAHYENRNVEPTQARFFNNQKVREDNKELAGLAKDSEFRGAFLPYRCYDNLEDPWLIDSTRNEEWTPRALLTEAQTLAVCPIFLQRRLWGIVELEGLRNQQFRWPILPRIARLANQFGGHLFDRWVLDHLHRIDRITGDATRATQEKFDSVARLIARLFCVRGAIVWYIKDVGRLTLAGEWNAQTVLSKTSRTNIHLDDPTREEANILRSKLNYKFTKVTGTQCGTLVPLKLENNQSMGCLVLVHDQEFISKWDQTFQQVGGHLARALYSVHTQESVLNAISDSISHMVISRANRLLDRATELPRFNMGEVNLAYTRVITDTRFYAEQIHRWGTDLSEDVLNWQPSDVFLERSLKKESYKGEIVQFREALNRAARSMRKIRNTRNLEYDDKYSTKVDGLRCKITEDALNELLTNLVDNAFKYASPSSKVNALLDRNAISYRFEIWNDAKELELGEETKIFRRGFRGKAALHSASTGMGYGLARCRAICKEWGLNISYSTRDPIEQERGTCTHRFTVDIPLDLGIVF